MRVGIIGTGWIAEKAAITLQGLPTIESYAVGSRKIETAQAFSAKWNIPRAYGSYSELIADPDVDLLYIATPHSHHFDVTKEGILAGKPCLVEKAFMANLRQSKEIIDLAHTQKVFLAIVPCTYAERLTAVNSYIAYLHPTHVGAVAVVLRVNVVCLEIFNR